MGRAVGEAAGLKSIGRGGDPIIPPVGPPAGIGGCARVSRLPGLKPLYSVCSTFTPGSIHFPAQTR